MYTNTPLAYGVHIPSEVSVAPVFTICFIIINCLND